MIETINGLTLAEVMIQTREDRLAEKGSGPLCPFCQKPRVARSVYLRCNPCGMNWGQGQDIFKHPHTQIVAQKDIGSTRQGMDGTARTARNDL